jgi:hypothetical protein
MGERDGEPEVYLIEHVSRTLAEDPRVGELELQVRVVGAKVFINGMVATPERQEAVTAVARELLPGYEVRNLTTVTSLDEPEEVERLT